MIPETCDHIVDEIEQRINKQSGPLLVALDGGSGSGKSTISACISQRLDVVLVHGDDFYAAHIPDATWNTYTVAEKVRDCIDWRRLRQEALEPLLANQMARWHPFDFAAVRPDGTYPLAQRYEERLPAPIILLDGAYSARPELADIIGLSILIDVPIVQRHARLTLRDDAHFLTSWHQRWDEAEAFYFTHIRPPRSFDLVVGNL